MPLSLGINDGGLRFVDSRLVAPLVLRLQGSDDQLSAKCVELG